MYHRIEVGREGDLFCDRSVTICRNSSSCLLQSSSSVSNSFGVLGVCTDSRLLLYSLVGNGDWFEGLALFSSFLMRSGIVGVLVSHVNINEVSLINGDLLVRARFVRAVFVAAPYMTSPTSAFIDVPLSVVFCTAALLQYGEENDLKNGADFGSAPVVSVLLVFRVLLLEREASVELVGSVGSAALQEEEVEAYVGVM